MKLAIIGAGATGLVSLKYGIEEGHTCDAYEKAGEIGGTWVYHDEITDENGMPISSPIYRDLRTNTAKESMGFLDFPYPQMEESFIAHPHVLTYLRRFANHFELQRHIRFYSRVTQVEPISSGKWSLTFQDVKTEKEECKEYDAIFVCNGHYNVPKSPEYPGQAIFKGQQFHSIYFRKPEDFKDKRVLIVGGFASAFDIAQLISEVSQYVYISHRAQFLIEPAQGVVKKPAISHFKETEVVFVDHSTEDIDTVIYCTGYKYDYPFLTESSGIQVENNWVKSLYKHLVNIEHPTMFFIGIPQILCAMPMFDIQVRFALASLKQHFCLPTKEEMTMELAEYMNEMRSKGTLSYPHRFWGLDRHAEYFHDLATTAGIRSIPPVVIKICRSALANYDTTQRFTIVDDENFIVTKL